MEPEHHVETEHRVTVLELFFDLVFVFAITQVTGYLASDLTLGGLARGGMLLALLWWAWVAYAWLTNTLHAHDPAPRVTLLAAMGAMLLVSLAVPRAFGDDAVLFAGAYALVRVLHVLLYYLATRGEPHLRGAVVRLAPPLLAGSALLVAGAILGGGLGLALWGAAIVVDYAGPLVAGPHGWRVDVAHFAERHGLIIIIALGEAVVSIGVGAAGLPLSAEMLAAALLAVVVSGALWWAYFDGVALAAERRLAFAEGAERTALARDGYSYLHLPMVAGIVLFALGVKKAIAHPSEPLSLVPALALYGGVALYLVGRLAFRLRNVGVLSGPRLALAIALGGVTALAGRISALASLALLAALCVGMLVFERWRH